MSGDAIRDHPGREGMSLWGICFRMKRWTILLEQQW